MVAQSRLGVTPGPSCTPVVQGPSLTHMEARYHHTWRPHKPVNASPEQKNLGWKAVNAASVAVAAIVTQRLLTVAWRLVRHEPPPSGPADRRVTWGAALTWATSMAVGIAVSRVVAVRLSGKVWESAVHEPPPEAPF